MEIEIVINDLANVNLTAEEISITKDELISYKRPKKQKWKVRDIFQIPLENGTYAFGQVVWKNYTQPV